MNLPSVTTLLPTWVTTPNLILLKGPKNLSAAHWDEGVDNP